MSDEITRIIAAVEPTICNTWGSKGETIEGRISKTDFWTLIALARNPDAAAGQHLPRLSKEARQILEELCEFMDPDDDLQERTALRALLDWYDAGNSTTPMRSDA